MDERWKERKLLSYAQKYFLQVDKMLNVFKNILSIFLPSSLICKCLILFFVCLIYLPAISERLESDVIYTLQVFSLCQILDLDNNESGSDTGSIVVLLTKFTEIQLDTQHYQSDRPRHSAPFYFIPFYLHRTQQMLFSLKKVLFRQS